MAISVVQRSDSPSLFIIAGPNGAGKSSTSEKILVPYNLTAFDWDQFFWDTFREYDCDPILERNIQDNTSEFFEESIKQSFLNLEDFAFETNFHGLNDIFWIKAAKKKHYKIRLLFFYMHDVRHCIRRVKSRIEQGGHPISDQTVKFRFKAGLENLNQNFHLFDEVRILDASLQWETKVVAEILDRTLTFIDKDFISQPNKLVGLDKLGPVMLGR